MRLTDFIASLLNIKNYQKLLVNKSRHYQIKQLNGNKNTNKMSSEENDHITNSVGDPNISLVSERYLPQSDKKLN